MIPQFDKLSPEEQEFMYKAPVLVAILIAGADGEIDRDEIREGLNQARKKQRVASPGMMELYREISEDFEDKLKIVLRNYPGDVSQRNALIVNELSQLNSVFPKIGKDFSKYYYDSICDLAMKIAKSSGGLLGMNSVGAAEAQYVKLPMVKDPAFV